MEISIMKSGFIISCFVLAASWCTPAAAETDCSSRPEPTDPSTCCQIPDFFSDEIAEKCKEFDVPMPPLNPPPPPMMDDNQSDSSDASKRRPRPPPHPRPPHPSHHSHHPCFMSCGLNKTNILSLNGKVDEAELHGYLISNFAGDKQIWMQVIEESFKVCLTEIEERRAKWAARKDQRTPAGPNDSMEGIRCPFNDAGPLMHCALKESFLNCPTGLWNDNDQCNARRSFMRDCKPKPLGSMENDA